MTNRLRREAVREALAERYHAAPMATRWLWHDDVFSAFLLCGFFENEDWEPIDVTESLSTTIVWC